LNRCVGIWMISFSMISSIEQAFLLVEMHRNHFQ
jgi:hypothetical protein